MKIIMIIVLCSFILGCSTPRITGLDDPLEQNVTLSSQSYSSSLVLQYESADPFLRGWIDKNTKINKHQLYIKTNSGNECENWLEVVFLKEGTRKGMKLRNVALNMDSSEYGIICYEDVAVDLELSDIEWLASQEETKMRLNSSRSTKKIDFTFYGDEAKSYLDSINEAMLMMNK